MNRRSCKNIIQQDGDFIIRLKATAAIHNINNISIQVDGRKKGGDGKGWQIRNHKILNLFFLRRFS